MKKRGQVGIFVIVGIVIVVLIVLFFFFRGSISESIREKPANTQEYLTQQLDDIKREIENCVSDETEEGSKLLMENAGNLNLEFDYIAFAGIKYGILCREFEDNAGCLSEPIFISSLESKLNKHLNGEVIRCIDFTEFENKDYEIDSGDLEVETKIFEDTVLVNVNFPVELTKDEHSVAENIFVYQLDNPLGELTREVNKLVQIKSSGEIIDPIIFGLGNNNKYRLEVKKTYPDELYDLSLTTNDNYHFYFAIEGIGNHERSAILI